MDEKKPTALDDQNATNPIDADTTAEKPESRIVDITDEFLGRSLIFIGAKKA